MNSKEALKIIKHRGLNYKVEEFEEAIAIIEKELKILEILKTKRVDLQNLDNVYEKYLIAENWAETKEEFILTEKEFNLILEWLENDE